MNPILLARHVHESLLELVHTTLNSSSRAFEGTVDRFLSDEANFLKGPWVSIDMPFRQAVRVDGSWDQPFPELPLKFAPYQHQLSAFERLGGPEPKSTLVATGTGSGKTEAYLWPILNHCRKNAGKPGIKAILIYPMNALATDQARRIASAITSIPSLNGIRAGIYADAQPNNATHEVTPDSIITHRDAMRNNPPDILLTNYKMLDYLLLRGQDKKLWAANDPESLRFLVVDEMHTFDGAQGADLALLIRRLKSRLRTPENHLICVGSSATLGIGDEAVADLRTYAETIFGEQFDAGSVVQETRKTANEVFKDPEYFEWPESTQVIQSLSEAEDTDQPGAAMRLATCLFPDETDPDLKDLHSGNANDPNWRILLGRLLLEHHVCQRVLRIINDTPGPALLEHIASELGQAKAIRDWEKSDHLAIAELVVSLVAWARSGVPEAPRPLFNVRLQMWIREMARMVSNIPRLEDGLKRSQIGLFHATDHDLQSLRRMLPIVNCNRCGTSAHIGRMHASGASLWAPLDQIYEEFFDDRGADRIRLIYHESIDRKVNATAGGAKIITGMLNADSMEFEPARHDDLEPGPASPVWLYDPTDQNGRMDRTCPACGHAQGLLLFGMRAARLTTGVTGTLYTSEQNEEAPEAKPRFLMFSDSVQDAAQRAAVTESRNARSVSQKSLYQALLDESSGGLSLLSVYQDLPQRYLDKLGGDDFTALFIAKEQTWRKRYEQLVKDNMSIADNKFLDHMKLRLGWEYFSDLTYRSHVAHTLEVNGQATANVKASEILSSADKLSRQIHTEYPSISPISPDTLAQFLAGVLKQMRRQGSVGHPYLTACIATNTRGYGLNYFGAAGSLGLGKTQTLPPLDHRRGLAPTPVTLKRSLRGFDSITQDRTSNWYRDWLFRVIAPIEFQVGTEPEVIYPLVFQRLEADGIVRRVDRPEGHDGHGYLLEPEHVFVSKNVVSLECNTCKRQEIDIEQNKDLAKGSSCTRIGCDGHLNASSGPNRVALKRSLRSNRNHRVVAREHTGILETNDRLRIETGFINDEAVWAPNLISATPTLEMGIDIGDLSTVLLCSVPPEEANYVQRMGRSGRRDGNALNMVLANARGHDLQFWEDPTPMLSGQVKSPGVYIAAEAVLLRQITAFTLDVYVTNSPEEGDYGKVREVLKRRKDGSPTGFPIEWLAMIEEKGDKLAGIFIGLLPSSVRSRQDLVDRLKNYLTSKDDTSLPWQVSRVFDEATEDRAKLLEKREELTKELALLRRRRAELTEEEFKKRDEAISRDRKEINRLIRTGIDDVSVLKFLTDKGILPNYAFPEEGVKLTSILSRRDEATHDDDGLLYLEYSRPASSALSEFAPGQIFYANGRQVEIERIEMSREDLSVWKFCQNCSFVIERHQEDDSQTCPRCGDHMWSDTGSNHEVVHLKSVIAIDSEDKAAIRDSDQRQQQQFDRAMVPFYGAEEIRASWYTKETSSGAPFGFEFVASCTFRDFNFGRKTATPIGPTIAGNRRPSQPFLICRHCGSLQRQARDENDRGDHPANCPAAKDATLPRSEWEAETFLMRRFNTEAIRLVIPVVGELEDDDVKSFIAGINLGMRRHFAGKVDHIRSTVAEAQLDGIATVRSLYLYDAVPGGSGYLRQLGEHPDTMKSVISKAAEALRDCPCNQDTKSGCYRCVKSYRSLFGPGEPDRDRARSLMETILLNWDTLSKASEGIDSSIRGALVESELERRFLGALKKAHGEDSLSSQVLSGGRRGFILKVSNPTETKLWTIEPQVQIDKRFKGLPTKRIDFLLSPVGRISQTPIVIEMDGLEYHADTVAKDLLDRLEMIRSGQVQVWTLSWHDLLEDKAPPFLNPLHEHAMSPALIGQLSQVFAHPNFSPLEEDLKALRESGSFQSLCRTLEGKDDLSSACSVLLRGIVGIGQPIDDLPRAAELSEEGRLFLSVPQLSGHSNEQLLDLYLACDKISPTTWLETFDDLRLLVRGFPPSPSAPGTSNAAYTEAWRGLWRLVNIFQNLRGFHVEFEGLDTLSPPSMLDETSEQDLAAWTELKSLTDELFYPLIDAMVAADVPAPDMIGDDILKDGRVIGMMEFGWSSERVAVAEEEIPNTGYRIIHFEPGQTLVGETISKMLKELGGIQS